MGVSGPSVLIESVDPMIITIMIENYTGAVGEWQKTLIMHEYEFNERFVPRRYHL